MIERGIEGQLERGGAGEGLAAGRDQPLLSTAVLAVGSAVGVLTYRALVVRKHALWPQSATYGADTLGLLLASVIAATLGVTALGHLIQPQ